MPFNVEARPTDVLAVMTLSEVLWSGGLLGALALYAALSVATAWLAARLEGRLEGGPQAWLWHRFYLPLIRAAVLCLFLVAAYPVLFGLADAPPITTLLTAEAARTGQLLGIVFLLSLALPLAPLGFAGPALVLPLQGAAAATLLFRWLTQALGLDTASLWAGLPTVAAMVGLALATHLLARRMLAGVHWAGQRVLGVDDLDAALNELLTLLVQVPVILIYTLSLGSGLTPPAGSPP